MKGIIGALAIVGIMLASHYFLNSRTATQPEAPQAPSRDAVQTRSPPAGAAVAPAGSDNSVYWSPFSTGAAPAAPAKTVEQRIAARRELMASLGINTPDQYFRMSFQELRTRAANKDIMAMLQLVAQFQAENAVLEAEADYDFGHSPAEQRKRYLIDALNAGHVHSATILAQSLAEQAPVEGLAWQMLAEQLGDRSGQQWGNKAFAQLSPAQRQQAQMRAAALYQQAFARFNANG